MVGSFDGGRLLVAFVGRYASRLDRVSGCGVGSFARLASFDDGDCWCVWTGVAWLCGPTVVAATDRGVWDSIGRARSRIFGW